MYLKSKRNYKTIGLAKTRMGILLGTDPSQKKKTFQSQVTNQSTFDNQKVAINPTEALY